MAHSKTARIGALIGAIVFFVTSAATSIAVIYQIVQDNKAAKSDTTATTDTTSAKNQNTTAANQKTNPPASQDNQTKLQGSKMQDFTPVSKIESLKKTDLQEGTGAEVKAGETITAHYTGAVAATGVVFQSSHDSGQPVSFSLGQVIKGWQEGVPGMKAGGKRRLLIPAADAYGANPPQGSGIPANADLVFDIELVKIGQ